MSVVPDVIIVAAFFRLSTNAAIAPLERRSFANAILCLMVERARAAALLSPRLGAAGSLCRGSSRGGPKFCLPQNSLQI